MQNRPLRPTGGIFERNANGAFYVGQHTMLANILGKIGNLDSHWHVVSFVFAQKPRRDLFELTVTQRPPPHSR